MTLIAIDAGGTHTRAVCLDGTGRALGASRGSSGNPTAVGRAAADAAVGSVIRAALAAAGVESTGVAGVTLCAAGQQDQGRLDTIVEAAGLSDATPTHLVGDAVAAFLAVTDAPRGIALIVGTGSIATRVDGETATDVSDGAGWLLGDSGGGFWLGHRVARAVAADLDGRGTSTTLTPHVLDRLEPGDLESWGTGRTSQMRALLSHVYEHPPVALARFADLAFAEASRDRVSASIVSEGAAAVAATLRRARVGSPDTPIAGAGSVLRKGYLAAGTHASALHTELAGAELHVSDDGLLGAAVLALRRAAMPTGPAVRARLAETLPGAFAAAS